MVIARELLLLYGEDVLFYLIWLQDVEEGDGRYAR